jgi:hypothetical protein
MSMKLGKPVYDSAAKLYNCVVSDGVRFTVRREEGVFVKPLDLFVDKNMLIESILSGTKGWFTKPLTQDYLSQRLQTEFPTPNIFEGEIEFQLQGLTISKEVFLLRYVITNEKEDEKICIELEDAEKEQEMPEPTESIPMADKEVMGLGPTRQQITKEKVLKMRRKAARALFIAERLTQEYYEEFGEDTDWEDETLSD